MQLIAYLALTLLGAVAGLSYTQPAVADIKTRLLQRGYTVQDGSYGFFTQDMCDKLDNCYANNPASPYGLIYLPPSPGEDTSTYGGWCEVLCSADKQRSASYRLNANETVILLGRTSPRSLYFSITSYMFDRFYPKGWKSPSHDVMGKCPKVTEDAGARCKQFASLHNPANMLTLNTSQEGEGGGWWDSSFAGFMGGDSAGMEAVQAIVESAGVPRTLHNQLPLPAGDIRLGTGSREADGFLSLLRVAFSDDHAAAQHYYDSVPFTVLRVTPPVVAQPKAEPFPRPSLRQRGSELETTPKLSFDDLSQVLKQDLYAGIVEAVGKEFAHVESYKMTPPTFKNGYDCLEGGTVCNGDSMDTTYPNSRVEILRGELCAKLLNDTCPIARRPSLGEDDFYIVTGVNHNTTGKALYSSVVMYDFSRLESVGQFDSSSQNSSYTGSALQYMPGQADTAQYLYAVKFARHCQPSEAHCFAVPYSGSNSLPEEAPAVIIERIYMDPMYESGPTLNSAVMPVIHHFSSKFIGSNAVKPLGA